MADRMLPGQQPNWMVSPSVDVEKKWLEVQIQERRSIIAKTKQDIEDLMLSKKITYEAKIMVAEQEIAGLEAELSKLEKQTVVAE